MQSALRVQSVIGRLVSRGGGSHGSRSSDTHTHARTARCHIMLLLSSLTKIFILVFLFLPCCCIEAVTIKGKLFYGFRHETVELSPNCSDSSSMTRVLKDGREPLSRTRIQTNTSGVFLKDPNYNDNGLYEFSCSDQLIQLLIHSNIVSVSEGESVKLPCFSVFPGHKVKSVTWKDRKKNLVLHLDLSSEEIRCGTGFKGRASLSRDWKTGNLSLILDQVQMKDQGDYICLVEKDGSTETGDPGAVRLEVQESPKENIQTTSTNTPMTKECSCYWMIGFWVLFAILVLILVGLCFLLRERCSSRRNEAVRANGNIPLHQRESTHLHAHDQL